MLIANLLTYKGYYAYNGSNLVYYRFNDFYYMLLQLEVHHRQYPLNGPLSPIPQHTT